ncbi:MAG: lasso peptide biosynthesis protein [Pirellulaceae bacterium]|nr:lasso peptide biosynthesis protein [Pirellulaceae bacterium]
MKYLIVWLLVLSSAVPAVAQQTGYYAIRVEDRLIGYATVQPQDVEQDGRKLRKLVSRTSLKLALLGAERNVVLDSETLLEPDKQRPISYRLTQRTNQTVGHVESEFDADRARTWIWAEGQARGEPRETALPDGWLLLGGNNFAHWQLLLDAVRVRTADRTAQATIKLNVFLPEAAQLETLELAAGEPETLDDAGTSRRCVVWRVEQAGISLLADAATNQFLAMRIAAQGTTVQLADESVVQQAQAARAEELLSRHFVQSNVAFSDFLRVTHLVADIDVQVIGSGVANDAAVLQSPGQKFQGTKRAERIVGQVTVRSVRYDPASSPPFPTGDVPTELAEWLKPSPFIESDDPAIVARAAELTAGAGTRWEAVRRIGRWVHDEIAYKIADTPSARLALEKKQGDCGPHATLMVAMLRAVKIPARLVGGLVYAPNLGGSFGQHAWVEVQMGPAGWVALDPTTGELEQLSATHIKLFEGLGGVVPTSVRVVSFEPPAAGVAAATPLTARPLPWKLDQQHTYRYRQGEQELGDEKVTIRRAERDGKPVYEMRSEMELAVNATASLKSTTTLVTALDVRPLRFERDLSVGGQAFKIVGDFGDGVVRVAISGAQDVNQEIKLPADTFCFDNNLLGSFALLCSQLTLETGKQVAVRTFHPSTLQLITLTFQPGELERVTVGDRELECFRCQVEPIKNTFWITPDGRLVRVGQGELTITLTSVPPP